MSGRLFHFLLKLATDRFYGDVTLHYKAGKIHGPIEVQQCHLEANLPQPDVTDPDYQRVVAEAVKGVGSEHLHEDR